MGRTHRQDILNEANVFAQPVATWQISVFCSQEEVDAVEAAFAEIALSYASFELPRSIDWKVTIYTDQAVTKKQAQQSLAGLKAKVDTVEEVVQKDWVSEVQKSFPPLTIGPFLVLGSHHKGIDTTGKTVIHLDAGCAFGTGEHATTSLCLKAMDWVMRQKPGIDCALDVGTGSGILAIGFASRYRKPVLAMDIDPVSIRVARENILLNRAGGFVRSDVAQGCAHPWIREQGQFPLILANILAKPLVSLAPAFARHLRPGGMLILSGLLDWQETYVLHAYSLKGIRLVKRFRRDGWSALVLQG